MKQLRESTIERYSKMMAKGLVTLSALGEFHRDRMNFSVRLKSHPAIPVVSVSRREGEGARPWRVVLVMPNGSLEPIQCSGVSRVFVIPKR